ncbi:MAG: alpha/beta fold hydrolase [Actinomycetota bacterium]
MMVATSDEFSLLDEEAREHHITRGTRHQPQRVAFATSSGATVSAIRWGDTIPEYLFLHGSGLNAHTWDAVIMALDAPAIALDLPGHGRSDWHDDADYSPRRLADELECVDFGGDFRWIVGQSLGGLTAIALAARRPKLARHLCVVDISPGLVLPPNNVVREFLAGPTSFDTRDAIVDRAISFGFGPSRRAVERGVFHNTKQNDDGTFSWLHHMAHLAATSPARTPEFSSLWTPLAQLGIPVMLVRGEHGFISEPAAVEFVRRCTSGTAHVLPCGHNVQEEQPVALAGLLAGR